MDTKSKSIKHSRALKGAALITAIFMFFLAGNFASLFIKGFANFNVYANPADFTNTFVFRREMNNYIYSAISCGQREVYASYNDYIKSQEAQSYIERFNEDANAVKSAYELLNTSEVETYVDAQNRYRYAITHKGIRYFFNCGGTRITKDDFDSYDFSSSEETVESTTLVQVETEADGESNGGLLYHDPSADGDVPEYIKEISNALEVIHNVDGHKDYGESTEENLLLKIENAKAAALEDAYYWHMESYNLPRFENIGSINYAVFYKNSDKVFTNCKVAYSDSDETIYEKLDVTRWAEEYKNGKYKLVSGKKNNVANGVYASLNEWLVGSVNSCLENYSGDEVIEKAYFSYNENYSGADSFVNMEKSFESYGKDRSLTAYLILSVVCFAAACVICIYLLCVAGKTADGIKINFFDKVPIEINSAFGLAVMALTGVTAVYITVFELFPFSVFGYNNQIEQIVFDFIYALSGYSSVIIGACVAVFFTVWYCFNASVLRNLRNKSFCRHSLILRPVKWLFKKLWKLSKYIFDRVKYVFAADYAKGHGKKFKVISCIAVALFVAATVVYYTVFVGWFMAMGACWDAIYILFAIFFLMLGVFFDALAVAYAILVIASLHRIMAAASDMRKGYINTTINTKFMMPFMKRFANDILSIQDGLQTAVESAVKDQKMKAELITNVSHDLKTPLTSIVNYVDLLKKCEIGDETAQKYVDVLDEKSQKMKKLIEDLVEASKVSSGAVEIRPVKLNLCEFAAQSVGEHEDELKKHGIEIVLRVPQKPVMVFADAQKTMRITENLFSNVRKYALEGTRVYVDVSEYTEIEEAENVELASITFKNISRNPLDVSAEELTHRFVRGDASRSGEGNGLGLSIAKDLCELQKGKLMLETDGDLFKATVKLPVAK